MLPRMSAGGLVLLASLAWPMCNMAHGATPVSVVDSIQLTRVVSSDPYRGHPPFSNRAFAYREAPPFRFSPDGTRLAVVLRRGDFAAGVNLYSLVVFDSAAIAHFLNSPQPGSLPQQKTVATFAIAADNDRSDRDAISEVRWLADSRSLAFIGRSADGIGQVYIASTNSGELRQLTHHSGDIAAFDLSADRSVLVFSAFMPPDWTDRNTRGYAFQAANGDYAFLLGEANPNDVAELNIEYFVQNFAESTVKRIEMAERDGLLRGPPSKISISPSGDWAVVPTTVRKLPSHWGGYIFLRDDPARVVAPAGMTSKGSRYIEFQDAFSTPDTRWAQYQLMDLKAAQARPLLDAPTMRRGMTMRMQAQWSRDSRRVLLPPTFMPLESVDAAETERRAKLEAVAEVDVVGGTVARLFDVPAYSLAGGNDDLSLIDIGWRSDQSVVARYLTVNERVAAMKTFRRRGNAWMEASTSSTRLHPADGVDNGRLALHMEESLNSSPEILATDLLTGRKGRITDLNPQLRNLDLGHAEVFRWTDRFGRDSFGGLVRPSSYTASARYPVVLQLGQFHPDMFLLDASTDGTSPNAARALASRGMIVLQIATLRSKNARSTGQFEDSGETPLVLAQVEGAVDALIERGIADPERIGLMGFSRYGMYTQYILAFSSRRFAAATIADSVSQTPYCYSLLYGTKYPGGMAGIDRDRDFTTIGAPLWGDGVQRWVDRSPLFHLDRIRTPTRYELYGATRVPCTWEYFAIQRRHQRAVEMFHIPTGSHNLKAPRAVYASKQGNVDWYAFWLKGEEDPAPEKAEQYARWRKLRDQQALSPLF